MTGHKVETELGVLTPSAERSVGQAEAPRTGDPEEDGQMARETTRAGRRSPRR